MEIVYRAEDGEIFTDEAACASYENMILLNNTPLVVRDKNGKQLAVEDYKRAYSIEFPADMTIKQMQYIAFILLTEYDISIDLEYEEENAKNRYWYYDESTEVWSSLKMFCDELKEKRKLFQTAHFPQIDYNYDTEYQIVIKDNNVMPTKENFAKDMNNKSCIYKD